MRLRAQGAGLVLAGLLPLTAAIAPVRAQAPAPQTPAWNAFEDSLAAISQATALPSISVPAHGASADAWLRRGFVMLRRFELVDRNEIYDSATDAFSEAEKVAQSDPWPSYAHGRALLESPEIHPRPGDFIMFAAVRKVIGRDPRTRGRSALLHAIALSPRFAHAGELLAASALETRQKDQLLEAAGALVRIDSAGGADARSLAALARLRDALDDLPAAEATARRALSLDPALPAAHLALAEALLRTPGREQEGAREYMAGAGAADARALEPYLHDIVAYLGQEKLDSLRAGGADGERNFLREFWDDRAALATVEVPARLAMHYRRLAVARERYMRRGVISVMDTTFARLRAPGPDEEFDDRGMVYVRYGDPDARTVGTVALADTGNTLTWYYHGTPYEPAATFHFLLDKNTPDYYLARRFGCGEPIMDEATQDPTIAQLIAACTEYNNGNTGAAVRVASYASRYREWVREAEHRESAGPNFTRDLPFWYDLATLAGGEGKSTFVAAVGVPAHFLGADTAEGRTRYVVRATLFVIDTAAGRIEHNSVTRQATSAAPLPRDAILQLAVDLPATPSLTSVYRLRVEDLVGGAGAVYGGPHPVPNYSPGPLALSDIVLAGTQGASWERDGTKLSLVPTAEFPGGKLKTYYEIYNLAPGAPFETEITVEPQNRGGFLGLGGSKAVKVSFKGEAGPDGGSSVLRDVETRLQPGRYRIRVRVKALNGGQAAERVRDFTVH